MGVTTSFIGLGANLGDRKWYLRSAVERVAAHPGIDLDRATGIASLFESSAVGGPAEQGPYLNSAIRVQTALAAPDLLKVLDDIELALGRHRLVRWGPRTVDLDLLLHGDLVVRQDHLSIPHPRLHERRFVLEPLAEIGGAVRHPVLGVEIARLAKRTRLERMHGDVVRLSGPEWAAPETEEVRV